MTQKTRREAVQISAFSAFSASSAVDFRLPVSPIASTGLIGGMTLQVRLPRILKMFAHNGGRELPVDGETYASESATGHRNRAIGHMPRNFGIIADDLMPAVEIPFCGAPASATAATYPPDLSPALRRKLRQAR